jgi:hypothetical protein
MSTGMQQQQQLQQGQQQQQQMQEHLCSANDLEIIAELQVLELQLGMLHEQALKLAADRVLINQQLQEHYTAQQGGRTLFLVV